MVDTPEPVYVFEINDIKGLKMLPPITIRLLYYNNIFNLLNYLYFTKFITDCVTREVIVIVNENYGRDSS